MHKIESEYVPGGDEGPASGTADVVCPVCGKRVHERNMGRISEEDTDRTIEACDDCLIEAEKETGDRFDSDVLPQATFQKLWDHLAEMMEDSRANDAPRHTSVLADLLGGTVWNSGGGIFLVLIRRTDGHVIAFSDECVCEYASMDELEGGCAINSIQIAQGRNGGRRPGELRSFQDEEGCR